MPTIQLHKHRQVIIIMFIAAAAAADNHQMNEWKSKQMNTFV